MTNSSILGVRTIIGYALRDKPNSGGALGFVRPLGELIDGKLKPVSPSNFCPTLKVFIPREYKNLEEKYPSHEIFQLEVKLSEISSPNVDPAFACQYVSYPERAESVRPKDLIEVVSAQLPDPNNRSVTLNEGLPGTRYIFVDNGTNLYGPFRWSVLNDNDESIVLKFVDSPLPYVKLDSLQIYEIPKTSAASQIIYVVDEKCKRQFVESLSIVSALGSKFYEYYSDVELVNYCAKLASDAGATRTLDKRVFSSVIVSLNTRNGKVGDKNLKNNGPLFKQRLDRFAKLTDEAIVAQQDVISKLNEFLKGELGRPIVENFVEQHQSQFLDKLKKSHEAEINEQLESKRNDIRIAEGRLRELNDNKVKLSAELEQAKRENKQGAVLDQARSEADSKLQQKKQELFEIDRQISEKSAVFNGLVTLDAIRQQTIKAKEDLENARRERYDQERINEAVRLVGSDTENSLREKLAKMRPFVDAINGGIFMQNSAVKAVGVKVHDVRSTDSLVMRQREIVVEMGRKMAEGGRSMQEWQVANLLISTQQSFITILAGLPGVGKTSLARLLAETQNIASERLAEVSVGRGWTSQKDLIGFYNPLSSRFQPSGTGLYAFLKALEDERDSTASAMAYVLLDEANLSPIEHYWSAFMSMTDQVVRPKLRLGSDEVVIPEYLRFIATINYDGTTEPLSPRIVDRAPIIFLDAANYGDTLDMQFSKEIRQPLPISAAKMQELFGLDSQEPELDESENRLLGLILGTLREENQKYGRPVSVSPRKIQAIRQFCAKAGGIMNVDREFLALDLAVLQHVLPLVRGNGQPFAKRLENLLRNLESEGLNNSAKYVSKMINYGSDDLHTYDFFCW